ncbi:MAG: hypothetical protein RQ748_08515, partial [Elusimicrobiales bacterium]|nr:hypothetical protein [Elusimicrobiales bacterium]
GLTSAGAVLLAAGFLMPGRAGAVSFRLGEGGAALLSAFGRASAIVSSGAAGEDLTGAALASGFVLPRVALLTCGEPGCAEGVEELSGAAALSTVYLPLWSSGEVVGAASGAGAAPAPVWPGDVFSEGGYEVRASWPPGQEGYSAPGDRLAYRFDLPGGSFTAGPGGTLDGQK